MRLLLLCLSLIASIGMNAKDKETKIAPGVWFEGAVNAEGLPTGHGTLRVVNAAKVKKATRAEAITGDFEGNVVKNAQFLSTNWKYTGDMQWNLMPEEEGLSVIEYHLTDGRLLAQTIDKAQMSKDKVREVLQPYTITPDNDTRIKRLFSEKGQFKLEPFCINYIEEGEDTDGQLLSITGEKAWTSKGTKKCEEFGTLLVQQNGSNDKTKVYANGTIVTEKDSHKLIETATGNYIDYDTNGRIVHDLVWSYPEAIVHYNINGKESSILYADGHSFKGEFSIGKLNNTRDLSCIKSINVPSLNDVDVIYRNGVETSLNGVTTNWSSYVTDQQQEKMGKSGLNLVKELEKLGKEMVAEDASKLEAARPQLAAKYGAANVNNIFNYKVEKGMPIELFRELRRMDNPLIEVSQEVYSSSDYFKRKTMMVVLRDRKTNEIVFQQFIHFNLGDRVYAITSSPISPREYGR